MKFTCSKEELDRQLQHVARIITVRHSLPILSNVLLETDGAMVRISGTDMELAVTTHIAAVVEHEGTFTVPAKIFQDFVHQNPDEELTFKLEGVELVCSSAKVQARITGIDPDEYPELPKVVEEQKLNLSTQMFTNAVKQVVMAAATDPARPVLTGVYMQIEKDGVTLAATDSFRLAEKKISSIPASKEQNLLIPARTVQELGRITAQFPAEENIEVVLGNNQLIFRLAGIELYSRLLTGNFPKYKSLIPTTFVAEAVVTSAELLQALRLATIFSQSGVANVMLEVDSEGTCTLASYGSQRGSAKHTLYAVMQAGFTPIRAAFNTRFLIDAVSAAGTDYVKLQFSGATSPLVIATDDPTYTQLVMPIRVDQ